jgi:WD40 repeat protein
MSATILPHSSTSLTPPPGDWPVGRVFGERPFRTDADVLAVAFGPCGLWSVEDGGGLRQWDVGSGRQLSWHALHEEETSWSFGPDGRLLAGASLDLTLWDVASGRRRLVIPQDTWVTALAFAPDSDLAATGHDDGIIRLWDTSDGRLVRQLRAYLRPVSALAFSPDGKRLASASEDKLMFVWNVGTGAIEGLLGGHTDRIPALVWHPDGRRLVSAGWDTTARVWDTVSFDPIILLNGHASQVVTLALDGDGGLLACADSANAVHVWDMGTYEPLHVFDDAEAEVRCLAFDAGGMRLAAGGADRSLHLWDPRRGQRLGGQAGTPGTATSISVSTDGKRLACVHGPLLRIWDARSGAIVHECRDDAELRAVAYCPDGRLLAIGGDRVELRDAATGQRQSLLEGPKAPVSALTFASAAPLVAAGSAASADVWIWDVRTGEPALMIPDAVPGGVVQALAFHPCRSALAVAGCDWYEAGGSDGAVVSWDLLTRRREALLGGGASAIAFDPTGRRLAVAGLDHVLRVWDLAERRLVGECTGHADAIRCLAYSPDGRWLASAGDDRTVRAWDAESGRAVWIASLGTQVTAICFAPDGRSLFTGNVNGSCSHLPFPATADAVHT